MPHRFARHRDRHLSRTGGRTQNRQYNRDTPIRRPDCRRRHAHLPHVHQPVGIRLTTENFFGSSSNRIHAIQHRPHAIRFNTDGAAPREGESHDRKNRKRQAPRGYRPDRPRGCVLAVQPGRAHGRADTVPMLRRDVLTRIVFTHGGGDSAAMKLLEHQWGIPVLAILCALSVVALLFRIRMPFAILCAICGLYLCACLIQAEPYLMLPLLFAVYTSTALAATAERAIAGMVLSGLSIVCGLWIATFPALQTDILLPESLLASMTAILALWSRNISQRRKGAALVEAQQQRSLELEQERDEERRRADVAAELHDSVGHNLTAIIALTEGLEGLTQEPVEGAIKSINNLARQSLGDTREAVRKLSSPVTLRKTKTGTVELCSWNDINPILQHARDIGIAAILTETGRRPDDLAQADLCFRVSREAVTNTMRHGKNITRIVVSWDHLDNGELHITVRDDGKPTLNKDNRAKGTGFGLAGLVTEVTRVGGHLHYGSSSGQGWTVSAIIPQQKRPYIPVQEGNDD